MTMGHYDIIARAAKMFTRVIVLVVPNVAKSPTFSLEERVGLIKKSVKAIKNVEVDCFDGLLADYIKKVGAGAIVKGLRAVSDFEYEFQMALTNKKLNPQVETLFLTTATRNMYLSSSMVKQIASMGGDISSFVPEVIRADIMNRIFIKKDTTEE